MRIYNFTLRILAILSLLIISCGGVSSLAKKTVLYIESSIPLEFGKNDEVLLIELHKKNTYNKYLRKYAAKHYKGKYEFLDHSTQESFTSTVTHRFQFGFTFSTDRDVQYTYDGTRNNVYRSNSLFYIIDRKNSTKISTSYTAATITGVIEGYMIAMEKQRIKNN